MTIPLIILRGDTPHDNAIDITCKKMQRELRAGREFVSPLFIRSPTDLSKSHVQVGGMSAGAKELISAIYSDLFDPILVSGGYVAQNETEAIRYMLGSKLVSEGKIVEHIGSEDSLLGAMRNAYDHLGSPHHVRVVAGDIPDVVFEEPADMRNADVYMNFNSFENIYGSGTKFPVLGTYPRYPTALFEDETGYHRIKEQNGLELMLSQELLQRSDVVLGMRKGDRNTMVTYLRDVIGSPSGLVRTTQLLMRQPVSVSRVVHELASTTLHNKANPERPKEYFDIMHIPLDKTFFSDLAYWGEQISLAVEAKNTAIGNMADIDYMLDAAYHNAVVQTDDFHPLKEVFEEFKQDVRPALERGKKIPTQNEYAQMFNRRAKAFGVRYGFDSEGKLKLDDFYAHSGISEDCINEYISLRDKSFNRIPEDQAPIHQLHEL